jgi:hypothetical protein
MISLAAEVTVNNLFPHKFPSLPGKLGICSDAVISRDLVGDLGSVETGCVAVDTVG